MERVVRLRQPSATSPLRVLVVTESFLPQVNGVTNSVRRVLDHLAAHGHTALLVAPSGPEEYAGFPVRVVRSVAMPTYKDFPIGLATKGRLRRIMADFGPDVVHLASPAGLGHQAGEAARSLGIPVVAVYQTDLIGFAEQYPFPGAAHAMRRLTRMIHGPADLNLVPSSASRDQLHRLGIPNLATWARGVDTTLFHPAHRSTDLREEIGADRDSVVVGYVGRLAAEKELHLLAHLRDMPRVRIVMVGGGPERDHLESLLPEAHFLGMRHGADLGSIVASFDVFVHTGRKETFCQSAQEALASGVPVVAPDAGGPVDLVEHGVNGFRYEPGNALELTECVAALVDDVGLRGRMGRSAYAGVRGRSWESVNDDLVDHFRDVLGVRPAAKRRAG